MSLEPDIYLPVRCMIELACGRKVTLDSLHQELTYSCCEGQPSMWANDWLIRNFMRHAPDFTSQHARTHLIAPVRRGYLRSPEEASLPENLIDPREWLPLVVCMALFTDVLPVRAPGMESALTAVWFQDEFAMPILEPALSAIRRLDWDLVATDVVPAL